MSDSHPRPLNRRHFLAGLTAAAGAAILAACGDELPTAAPAAPTTGSTAATTGAAPTAAPAVMTRPAGTTAATTGAAPAAPANVQRGGTFTDVIIATDAKWFHPYLGTDIATQAYVGNIFGGGGLTRYDENTLEQKPFAAKSWTISPDKKTYTYTLRDDLKWSDGKEMTTDDYVWSFQQAFKPENQYPYRENLTKIESYTAQGPRTLVVVMKDALVTGLENSDVITPLPRHIWEKYDWSDPTKNPEINAPTVGNGMWKLKEWKRDNFATFVANDAFFDGRPNIDTYVVRVVGTFALAFQALKSGEVDTTTIQPNDYREAKGLMNATVFEWFAARGTWGHIGFNLRRPVMQDINLRRAVAYASDRKGIVESVLNGLGREQYTNLVQGSWAFNSSVEKYDFDPKKAADAFKQAGYTSQGGKLTKGGQPLTLKLIYPTSSKIREGIATVLQQQLSELGVAVNVQGLEFQAFQDVLKREPFDFDLWLGGWASTIEPYFGYQLWQESSIPQLNYAAYINKNVEMLFDQSSKEFDREKRKAIFGQIQKTLTDEMPYHFLYESKQYQPVNRRVGGVTVSGLGLNEMNKWYITGNK